MPPLLDPKLDIVFKLLLTRPGRERVLVSLLSAVLHPPAPIASVVVLNPELLGEAVDDKHVVLDVLVRLEDGRRVDVEMQMRRHAGVRRRALMYWARLFESQLGQGDAYDQLQPVSSVFLLADSWLPGDRFHSIFRLLEVHDHGLFSDAIELHTVELAKLQTMKEEERKQEEELVRWGAFLTADGEAALEALAQKDPIMREAKEALEELSADPQVRYWAERRALGQKLHRFELAEERRQGIEQGVKQGIERTLRRLLRARFGDVPAWLEARIESASVDELDAWSVRVVTATSLEEVAGDG
jgi:predicted transposase/invertase (TIGR01784 family)